MFRLGFKVCFINHVRIGNRINFTTFLYSVSTDHSPINDSWSALATTRDTPATLTSDAIITLITTRKNSLKITTLWQRNENSSVRITGNTLFRNIQLFYKLFTKFYVRRCTDL